MKQSKKQQAEQSKQTKHPERKKIWLSDLPHYQVQISNVNRNNDNNEKAPQQTRKQERMANRKVNKSMEIFPSKA